MEDERKESFSKLKVYSLLGFGITAIGFSPILVKIVTHESPFLVAAVRFAVGLDAFDGIALGATFCSIVIATLLNINH